MNTLAGARVERPKKHLSATQSLAAATTPELGRLTFQHSTVDGRCSGCGYESTVTEPLCPVTAAALGELLRRGPNPSTRSIKLSKLSTNDLLVSASAHRPTPAGRCHRCGFAYTAQCQDCPSLRLIRQELEARGMIPLTQPDAESPPCAGKSATWELAGQSFAAWRRAIESCKHCPFLTQCRDELNDRMAQGDTPHDQIVAGEAFDYYGDHVPANRLRAYAVLRNRRPRRYTTATGAGDAA